MFVVQASQQTGSASVSQLMDAVKEELAKETGYSPVGDETLSIGGLAAAKHTYRIVNSPEFNNIEVVGVVIVARRGDNLVVLMGVVAETAYENKKATLDKIVASLVVK